jgi:hypothetical protein
MRLPNASLASLKLKIDCEQEPSVGVVGVSTTPVRALVATCVSLSLIGFRFSSGVACSTAASKSRLDVAVSVDRINAGVSAKPLPGKA